MRRVLTAAACMAAFAAGPAWSQGNSGNAGPPDGAGGGPPAWAGGAGGVPGGGADGAGPPMAPPGLGTDPNDAARIIADQQGGFGRDFAAQQRDVHQGDITGPEQAELQRARAAQYFDNAQIRRDQAQQYSTAMRNGAQVPADAAKTLRDELRADMESWRDTFRVERAEWQAARDDWLDDRDALSAEQWAQRRLDWFVFRDAWIARQQQWAQARPGED